MCTRPPPLQAALCYLSPQEVQCLLGWIITKHGSALGPRSGPAGSELLSSSAAAAAARGKGYPSGDDAGSSSGGGSSVTSSGGSSSSGGEDFASTPDLGSPSAGAALVASGGSALTGRGGQQRDARLPSYEPGCASVFGFSSEAARSSGGGDGGDSAGSGGEGAALLGQQLALLAGQPAGLLRELPEGRGLTGEEVLEPHAWWIDHLSHKVRRRRLPPSSCSC